MTSKQSQSSLSNGFVPPVTTTWFRTYRLRSAQSLPFQKFFVFKFYTSRQKSCKLYNLCCCESGKTDILVELKQLLHTTPIYLIGMMGSGKSTVGRHLATKLCYSFLDTDQMIESVERKKITEIFQEQGEDKFRVIESNILNQIQPCRGHVVATGGGIVLRSSNWAILRNGVVIFLDVSVVTITTRLLNDTSRPLLKGADLEKRLEEIRSKRLLLYQQADIHIQLNDSHMEQEYTPEQWTELITKRLFEYVKAAHQSFHISS